MAHDAPPNDLPLAEIIHSPVDVRDGPKVMRNGLDTPGANELEHFFAL